MCACAKSLQLCPTLRPHRLQLTGSSVHGILQARILEWVAIPFSKGSSGSRDSNSHLHCGQFLYHMSYQGSPCFPLFLTEFSHNCPLSLRFSSHVAFLSEFSQKSSSFVRISFKITFFLSSFPLIQPSLRFLLEIFFLSWFPQKYLFCQVSLRYHLFSVKFSSEIFCQVSSEISLFLSC